MVALKSPLGVLVYIVISVAFLTLNKSYFVRGNEFFVCFEGYVACQLFYFCNKNSKWL